jgi:hypothetical protein
VVLTWHNGPTARLRNRQRKEWMGYLASNCMVFQQQDKATFKHNVKRIVLTQIMRFKHEWDGWNQDGIHDHPLYFICPDLLNAACETSYRRRR